MESMSVTYSIGDMVKFPSNIGITGLAIKTGKIIDAKEGRANSSYNSRIDNITGTKLLKDIIVIPLQGDADIIGIMQLVNKEGEGAENEQNYWDVISKLVGSCLSGTKWYGKAYDMITSMKKVLYDEKIMKAEDDRVISNEVFEHMLKIKEIIREIDKKQGM